MRIWTVAMVAMVMGCGGADTECKHLQSTAGEPGGDEAYYVFAEHCADGVDKQVDCAATDAGWDCVCSKDGVESGEVADDAEFDEIVRSTTLDDALDRAILTVADDCGW